MMDSTIEEFRKQIAILESREHAGRLDKDAQRQYGWTWFRLANEYFIIGELCNAASCYNEAAFWLEASGSIMGDDKRMDAIYKLKSCFHSEDGDEPNLAS